MPASAVPLTGKLEQHSFATVLRELLHEQRDGCLTVSRGATTRRLYLRGGMITYGSSTDRQDRLGEILVAQGKLSKADYKKYWELSQAGNQLLGITLVLNGRITLHDLYQGVTAQVVTILDRVQKWRKGDYAFEEGREPVAGTVLLRIPLALYLRPDTEKKPAAKRPAKRTSAKKKSAAAGRPAPREVADGEEQELELHDTLAGEETLTPAAAYDLERLGEVSFMVQELRKRLGQDPLALLGVTGEADRAAVQAAYHRIAKVLHPDRLPKGCTPELLSEAEDIYREVTAAAQAAEEEVHRHAAASASASPVPARGRPAPSEDEQSRRFFAQGREWIAKRNYWQAADALRQAVRLKPAEAIYRQYLGLSLLQTKRLHEAEEHLVEAARLEPGSPAHYVNLGRIYRAGKRYGKAREVFERALRIDPRNEHARDELSDLPEDRPSTRKTEGGGLFKKLFGKG